MDKQTLERRRAFLGASEVAAVLGRNPFMSPGDVFSAKTMPVVEREPTEEQEFGSMMEAVVLEWFSRRMGRELQRPVPTRTRGIIGATPDAIVVDPATGKAEGVEAKTSGQPDQWGTEGTDEIPEHIVIQAQMQAWVFDFPLVWVPVRLGGFREKWGLYCVRRHEQLCQTLAALAEKWWNDHVRTGVPPDDYVPSIDILGDIPRAAESCVELPESAIPILDEYIQAREAAKEAEIRKDVAYARVVALLGVENPVERGILPDGRSIRYSIVRGGDVVDVKRLRAEHPQVYSAVTRSNQYRRLYVSQRKSQ